MARIWPPIKPKLEQSPARIVLDSRKYVRDALAGER